MLDIFAIHLLEDEKFIDYKYKLISALPIEQQDKYDNYKHSGNLQRSLLGELMIRKILSEKLNIHPAHIPLLRGNNGKPYIENQDLHFNISHSGKWVVAAFSDKELGIDIELIRDANYNVAERFYSKAELLHLNSIMDENARKKYFFDLWTLKESYLKAIGTGLTKSLSSFTIEIKYNSISITDDKPIDSIYFRQYEFDNAYKLAVCSFDNDFCKEIKVLEVDDIL
ncbi:MAG: 4'-phosphopantetheinyl transferase superfamily protein [Bacteroidetes bacterium]|nr:4'-phosphopantetheinyl transferase superfamily protein [Bacteroidota bacterium]